MKILLVHNTYQQSGGEDLVFHNEGELLESFANATPALVSDIGSLAEIVEHGKTGLKFEAGNTNSLIKTVEIFLNDSNRQELSLNARQTYLANYTPSTNYKITNVDLPRKLHINP